GRLGNGCGRQGARGSCRAITLRGGGDGDGVLIAVGSRGRDCHGHGDIRRVAGREGDVVGQTNIPCTAGSREGEGILRVAVVGNGQLVGHHLTRRAREGG